MDVQFEKITQLGAPYFRYIPIFEESLWTKEMREFYEKAQLVRKDLNVLNLDGYWDQLLGLYLLETVEETKDGAFLRIYHLKKNTSLTLPSKVACILAAVSQGIRFETETQYLESRLCSGRMAEYIVLKGVFYFNEGSFFDPFWVKYEV